MTSLYRMKPTLVGRSRRLLLGLHSRAHTGLQCKTNHTHVFSHQRRAYGQLNSSSCRVAESHDATTEDFAKLNLRRTTHLVKATPLETCAYQSLLGLVQINRTDVDLATAPAVFLMHGAISNGSVFQSNRAKGLGPFLAKKGFNVFVGDLRGRGNGSPTLKEEAALLGKYQYQQP